MNRKEVHLYRVKFIKSSQQSLIEPDRSPKEIFLEAINEKPKKLVENGTGWTIGNITLESATLGAFAVGRITKKSIERFDEETGNFVEEIGDAGPYTLVFFDAEIGLLGILKKSSVGANPASISRRLQELFERSNVVKRSEVDVKISYIPDPDDFISKIRSAYRVVRFRATFTGPNPIDADEVFQKPLSVYCQAMSGDTGSVEVVGGDLDAKTTEAVAKSTAATANAASATIIENRGRKRKRIHLKKGALVAYADLDSGRKEILKELQSEYLRVRT